jgi:hypothetical protein
MGQQREIFTPGIFLYQKNQPGPLIHALKSFLTLVKMKLYYVYAGFEEGFLRFADCAKRNRAHALSTQKIVRISKYTKQNYLRNMLRNVFNKLANSKPKSDIF